MVIIWLYDGYIYMSCYNRYVVISCYIMVANGYEWNMNGLVLIYYDILYELSKTSNSHVQIMGGWIEIL